MITDVDYKSLSVKRLYLPGGDTSELMMQKILNYQSISPNNSRFTIYEIHHIIKHNSEFAWIYYYGTFPKEKEYKPNGD